MHLLDPTETTDAQKAFLDAVEALSESFQLRRFQSTRPLTLAYGLSDSPVGLAAWLIDHFELYSSIRLPPDNVARPELEHVWSERGRRVARC